VSVENTASLLEECCRLRLDHTPATEYVPPEHRPQLDAPAHYIQTYHRLGPDMVLGQLQLSSMCPPFSKEGIQKGMQPLRATLRLQPLNPHSQQQLRQIKPTQLIFKAIMMGQAHLMNSSMIQHCSRCRTSHLQPRIDETWSRRRPFNTRRLHIGSLL
jgi:hypothetical protein